MVLLWHGQISINEHNTKNGATVARPNLHQRAQYQAKTIQHLVKYQIAQCYKKYNLYTQGWSCHPTNPTEKNLKQPTDCWKGLSMHNQDQTGAQRLVYWSCQAQYKFNCMMSNHTQIVRTQTTQRWQCTHCSQKLVADRQDNQIAPVLDKKSPGAHQYLSCIL